LSSANSSTGDDSNYFKPVSGLELSFRKFGRCDSSAIVLNDNAPGQKIL